MEKLIKSDERRVRSGWNTKGTPLSIVRLPFYLYSTLLTPHSTLNILLFSFFIFLFIPNSATSKPNIIFIMVDDLGKEWISSYGADNISTPQVDALAAGGMKFTNAYSMPKCTPTRVTLLTGQYPYNHGWVNHWDVPRWSPENAKGGGAYFDWKYHISFGRIMKSAGYATAIAGKWQINDFRVQPDALVKHGFDEYCMWTGGESGNPPSDIRYWDPYIHTEDGSRTYTGEYGPDIFLSFIQDFIGRKKDEPFMVYFPMALTHTPFVTTPANLTASTNLEKHIAMTEYTDYIVGEIVATLEEHSLDSNTILIFTTDNGTVGSITGSLNGTTVQGGKSQNTENGVNNPFVVYGPGLVPAGVTMPAITDFTDILPTFAELAGVNMDSLYAYYDLDGVSIAPVLLGQAQATERQWILAMGGGVSVLGDSGVEGATPYRTRVLQDGRFKVHVDGNGVIVQLYDLQTDPFEGNNILGSATGDAAAALAKFQVVIAGFPEQDARFVYEGALYDVWPDSVVDLPATALSVFSDSKNRRERSTFEFNLSKSQKVRVDVIDIRGKNLGSVFESHLPAGRHKLNLKLPPGLSPGIYFFRVTRAGHREVLNFVHNL